MRVAAYQAPLDACASPRIVDLIREQIMRCEAAGVEILCCPEAVLGGLADYSSDPNANALGVDNGGLLDVLAPLASATVTTIVGFTESGIDGRLHNSAAVFQRGSVAGVYRKLHPAINKSVYAAGDTTPVFAVGDLTFGIAICLDSTFSEPARAMAAQGATALFVPTNNGLPRARFGREIVMQSRDCSVARATEHRLTVIRADVAGEAGDLVSYGSSSIVDPEGHLVISARELEPDLIVADIATRAPSVA